MEKIKAIIEKHTDMCPTFSESDFPYMDGDNFPALESDISDLVRDEVAYWQKRCEAAEDVLCKIPVPATGYYLSGFYEELKKWTELLNQDKTRL